LFTANATEAICGMLEALNCRNITETVIPMGPVKRAMGGKTKGYSDYHVLKVNPIRRTYKRYEALGGSHASPREHLRRGHIHSFKTKTGHVQHWIDALVVNPGNGGCIAKDYLLV
jgi:hypothetical protein